MRRSAAGGVARWAARAVFKAQGGRVTANPGLQSKQSREGRGLDGDGGEAFAVEDTVGGDAPGDHGAFHELDREIQPEMVAGEVKIGDGSARGEPGGVGTGFGGGKIFEQLEFAVADAGAGEFGQDFRGAGEGVAREELGVRGIGRIEGVAMGFDDGTALPGGPILGALLELAHEEEFVQGAVAAEGEDGRAAGEDGFVEPQARDGVGTAKGNGGEALGEGAPFGGPGGRGGQGPEGLGVGGEDHVVGGNQLLAGAARGPELQRAAAKADFDRRQRRFGRAGQGSAVRGEASAMARAFKAVRGAVPSDRALLVGAESEERGEAFARARDENRAGGGIGPRESGGRHIGGGEGGEHNGRACDAAEHATEVRSVKRERGGGRGRTEDAAERLEMARQRIDHGIGSGAALEVEAEAFRVGEEIGVKQLDDGGGGDFLGADKRGADERVVQRVEHHLGNPRGARPLGERRAVKLVEGADGIVTEEVEEGVGAAFGEVGELEQRRAADGLRERERERRAGAFDDMDTAAADGDGIGAAGEEIAWIGGAGQEIAEAVVVVEEGVESVFVGGLGAVHGGAPAAGAPAGVGGGFENLDLESALGELDGRAKTGEPGADDHDAAGAGGLGGEAGAWFDGPDGAGCEGAPSQGAGAEKRSGARCEKRAAAEAKGAHGRHGWRFGKNRPAARFVQPRSAGGTPANRKGWGAAPAFFTATILLVPTGLLSIALGPAGRPRGALRGRLPSSAVGASKCGVAPRTRGLYDAARLNPTMMVSLQKLQSLLRELFQFELSDLDFGIYRLFRLRKDELDKFIGEQIPQAVEKAFADLAEGDTGKLKAEVADLAQKICEELELDAILDDGSLNPRYDKNTIGKTVRLMVNDYEEKYKRLRGLLATENQKDDVFNHLHAFFSRYYDRGDFIARRFFGARPRYAVPYNGEETHFHWANKDQHYVKSGEAFRDYSFTVPDILGGPARVRFALTKASLPPGDTKGDRRYFFPQPGESKWDTASRTFTIAFHYRLPAELELKSAPVEGNGAETENGESNGENGDAENGKAPKPKKISGDKLQEKLLADALDALIAACPEAGLADALRKVLNQEEVERDGKPPVTYLAKRMRHFARRQTSDYFVHKNLAAFLREELDFYIKDQVIHVADLEGDFEGKRRMLRALRKLAGQIIAFLHQIEEVQRRLFEKRKFVLRTDYLCPVQNVPRPLWKEICANKRQLAEWVDLYALGKDGAGDDDLFAFKGRLTDSFLENHPTLVVNTALFDDDFKWRLLESFDDLDAVTDGVLVKSENYQALRLMTRALAERVDFTYIDPPYNTGDDFIYKDNYQRSSWLALLAERLELGRDLMKRDGAMAVSIDDAEFGRLVEVSGEIFPDTPLATLVWDRNRKNDARYFSVGHEYMLVLARSKDALSSANIRFREPKEGLDWAKKIVAALEKKHGKDYDKITEYWLKAFDDVVVSDPKRRLIRYNKVGKRGPFRDDKDISWPGGGGPRYEVKHPDTKQPVKIPSRGWMYPTVERFWEAYGEGDVVFGVNETTVATGATYLFEDDSQVMPSVFYSYAQTATQEFEAVCGKKAFDNPKPWRDILRLTHYLAPAKRSWVLDYFGGSGTTIQAVTAANRQDAQERRTVLVEMGDYFDSVVLKRTKRVLYAPDWKDELPTRRPTSDETKRTPRLVKVLRLESYEDALHNLATDATLAASEAKAAAFQGALGAESYRLHYLARLPMEASASMLQTARLDHPFRYSLEILTDDGAEARTVDLVETFNWLLGLDVQRVRRWQHEKRDYLAVTGCDRANKRLLVVWRDTADLDPKAERVFLEKQVAALTKDAPFDRMLINGDSATPGFESLDALFKQLMEAD